MRGGRPRNEGGRLSPRIHGPLLLYIMVHTKTAAPVRKQYSCCPRPLLCGSTYSSTSTTQKNPRTPTEKLQHYSCCREYCCCVQQYRKLDTPDDLQHQHQGRYHPPGPPPTALPQISAVWCDRLNEHTAHKSTTRYRLGCVCVYVCAVVRSVQQYFEMMMRHCCLCCCLLDDDDVSLLLVDVFYTLPLVLFFHLCGLYSYSCCTTAVLQL